MTQKELAEMYGIKPKTGEFRDKKKAMEIAEKILKCKKCGTLMKWVEDTNICVCLNCSYSIGKGDNKQTYNISRPISDKSRKFLTNNYSIILAEIAKEESEKESEETTND